MAPSLTIVMYHYVRDPAASRFPRIKGLSVERFDRQLDHIARHYTVVGEPAVAAAWARPDEAPLPPDACWLTFDDGFIDHYRTVHPRLAERGWPASFYPPAGPLLTGRLLDVHRIHFILAAVEDPAAVLDALLELIAQAASEPPQTTGGDEDVPAETVPPLDRLRADYLKPNRFDGAEVNFIKRVLQAGLPERVRGEICARLFARFVTGDEAGFAGELYMSLEQLRRMASEGMSFGGHGFRHRWLGELPPDQQADEIDRSVELLKRIYGPRPRPWSMCFPYGSYNARTLDLLAASGCSLGLTTRVAVAALSDPALELPRLDTNDLPS